MPLTYWNDAFSSVVYLINRLPSYPLDHASPYEKLFQVPPTYSFLRVFGYMCFPNLRPYNTHKLQFRLTPCTFLGYSPLHKGYRCQDGSGRVYVSHHVTFNETVFPFKTITSKSVPQPSLSQTSFRLLVLSSISPSITCPPSILNPLTQVHSLPTATQSQSPSQVYSSPTTSVHRTSCNDHCTQPPPPACVPPNSYPMVTRSKAGIFKPKAYMSTTPSISDHTLADIHEAMANESWKATMHNELHALLQNCTWSICSLPDNRRAIGCKWLFKVKKKANGSVDLMKGWPLRQVDVNNAFLNGELTEEICMTQPLGLKRYVQMGLFLNQKKYITEIIHKTGMSRVSATPTPTVSLPKLVASDGSPSFADGHLYRIVVGMLQYVCITRLDLSFCVNKLSQYMNSPSESHWKAVKRVLRYLIGTLDHGLYLSKGQFALVYYSDADWASSVEDRRSTTGYVVYLGANPVAWCSKKQPVVSRSSSEAEYRSLDNCVSELLWVKWLLDELSMPLCQPPVIWCDNASTVSMAANPTHHARVKHVEIDHHFVREKVLDGTLQVNFVLSEK
ncbi:hypothetical protein CXB51_016615 [Gossypium anomalum]|uniref:Retroviral polymerase SH3-like domain-containing protein n=1 Tax=Gossypium anomalum TaxID=47600 RepID=A0A8J5ZI29_9ROSI|nr:hypothetical protein CXB51_016615 [Gossypium anomalum]